MKLATLIAAISIVTASTTARADDDEAERRAEEDFIPLGVFPQIGLGFATQISGDRNPITEDADFDGSVRWSPSWKVAPRTYAGGFLDVRTVNFDRVDFAVGPQVQRRIGKGDWAVQGRAGVGSEMEGEQFAVAGVQIGTFAAGVSVSGRHYFDDDRQEISVNLELTSAILLIPVWLASPGF